MKSRAVATAGLLVALQLMTLAIGYIIPTINLALLFAASVYPGILLKIGFSKKAVIASFFASGALTILLIQIPIIQAAFAAFFGWYGIIHESTRSIPKIKQQLIRWACFFVSAGLMYAAVRYIISIELSYALWILALIGVAAFIFMQWLYGFTIKEAIKITKIKLINGKISFK